MTTTLMKRHIIEAASLVGETAREDGAWKVLIISEGQGSSGYYSRELLEEYHHVFNDVLSFTNHPTGWDGPEDRDFTMIAGEVLGETWVENDERGMAAVYGWYLADEAHRDKLERYKKKLGVSIFAFGEGEWDDRTGNFNVMEFAQDPYTSVDIVLAAGARGKIMESMKKTYAKRVENASATSAEEIQKKEGVSAMEIKDLADKIDKLAEANDAIIAKFEALLESKQKEAQAEVDADFVATEAQKAVANYVDAEKLIENAKLLPSQSKELIALAMDGKEVTEAMIESAKTIATEARESVGTSKTTESGAFSEGSKSNDYEFRGFKGGK